MYTADSGEGETLPGGLYRPDISQAGFQTVTSFRLGTCNLLIKVLFIVPSNGLHIESFKQGSVE